MTEMVAADVLEVSDDTFAAQVLEQDGAVLVDFWAQWCPPCHMIAPVLAQVARERAEKLRVAKINADENPVTAGAYGVLALPTLILFVNGKPIRSLVGARSRSKLLAEVDAALA